MLARTWLLLLLLISFILKIVIRKKQFYSFAHSCIYLCLFLNIYSHIFAICIFFLVTKSLNNKLIALFGYKCLTVKYKINKVKL